MKAARLTAAQKVELWQRWRQGQSLSVIGRALERSAPAIFSSIRGSGGFSPVARKRSQRHLSLVEREEISCGIAAKRSIRSIAKLIGRSASTVCRELKRNRGRRYYSAVRAERRAWIQGVRPKNCHLAAHPELCKIVAKKLLLKWSPQQIAGHLKNSEREKRVSHETIDKSLFIQARNLLKRELCASLRTGRLFRKGRNSTLKGMRGTIKNALSISERPPDVEDRAIPGHWEGDLIVGTKNSCIATLVERKSRYVMLVRVRGKDTKSVIQGLIREVKKLPTHLRQSLTWDRGLEMARHHHFTVATQVKVFFCDPHSPWQRGSNENTNGLLRQYFPKGTSLSEFTQTELSRVARQLNSRPRMTLDWKTPGEVIGLALR